MATFRLSPATSDHSTFSPSSLARCSFSSYTTCRSPSPPTVACPPPPFVATMATPAASPFRPLPVPPPHQVPPSPPQTVQQAQASTLAVFAAEMIVWIWFSPTTTALNADVNTTRTEHMDETERGTTEAKRRQAQTASKQQVAPTERFLRFTHEVLSTSELPDRAQASTLPTYPAFLSATRAREERRRGGQGARASVAAEGTLRVTHIGKLTFACSTAQVSHSVVILALLFIFRLKKRNSISGAPGSEFRLTCTALMLANKVLDDNSTLPEPPPHVQALASLLTPLLPSCSVPSKDLGRGVVARTRTARRRRGRIPSRTRLEPSRHRTRLWSLVEAA